MNVTNIREWISFGADICILFITIYTFYKTFLYSRLSLLQIKSHLSNKEGIYHQIVLLNKKTSPVVVTQIRIFVDDKYILNFYDKDPIVIEGYSSSVISSENYSYTNPEIQIIGDNIIVEVTIESKKKVYLKRNKNIRHFSRKKIEQMKPVMCVINQYNEKIIPQYAKYVIVFNLDDRDNTLFVFESGSMTGEILGYNELPKKALKSKETLAKYLKKQFSKYGIQFYVDEVNNNNIF